MIFINYRVFPTIFKSTLSFSIMKFFIVALGFLILFSLSFAAKDQACLSECNSSYTQEVNGEKNLFDAKGYYCGFTDTNCWARSTNPSGQPDPCWSLCYVSPYDNNAFQSCCFESAQINAQKSYDRCVAACPEEQIPLPKPPEPNCQPEQCTYSFQSWAPYPDCECLAPLNYWNKVKERFTMKVTSITGTVWIKKNGKSPRILLTKEMVVEPGDIIATSENGAITVERELPNGGRHVETLSKLQTLESVAYCSGKPCDFTDVVVLHGFASSEHSSIRGTINGGGDFVMILPPLSILADISPPPIPNLPVMSVYELSNDGTHDAVFFNMSGKLIQVKSNSVETRFDVYENTLRDKLYITLTTGSAVIGNVGETTVSVSEGYTIEASATGVGQSYLQNQSSPEPEPNPPNPEPSNCWSSAFLVFSLLGMLISVRRP